MCMGLLYMRLHELWREEQTVRWMASYVKKKASKNPASGKSLTNELILVVVIKCCKIHEAVIMRRENKRCFSTMEHAAVPVFPCASFSLAPPFSRLYMEVGIIFMHWIKWHCHFCVYRWHPTNDDMLTKLYRVNVSAFQIFVYNFVVFQCWWKIEVMRHTRTEAGELHAHTG